MEVKRTSPQPMRMRPQWFLLFSWYLLTMIDTVVVVEVLFLDQR